MRSSAPNAGSVALTKIGETGKQMAVRVGTTAPLISNWRRGQRLPGPEWRAILRNLYAIPVEAWDQPPPTAAGGLLDRVAQSPTPVAQVEAPRQPAEVQVSNPGGGPVTSATVDAKAYELLAWIDSLRAEAERDPTTTVEVRTKAAALAVRVLRDLDDQLGVNLSEARILRSRAFRRIVDAIKAALRLHPEAAVAVSNALRDLE